MKTEITNTYLVFFEIFGKKMKAQVQANSEEEARYLIMGKLIFHKIVRNDNGLPPEFDEIFQKFR